MIYRNNDNSLNASFSKDSKEKSDDFSQLFDNFNLKDKNTIKLNSVEREDTITSLKNENLFNESIKYPSQNRLLLRFIKVLYKGIHFKIKILITSIS